tara:strand:- start:106 stop:741 length:636 start_codon:yes stop_codon:yes gene_type:complete
MNYQIKEIFYTLQGEGINAGKSAVFCRFTGCNLWSGKQKDRDSAVCNFCDTDFIGTDGTLGGKYISSVSLAQTINKLWPRKNQRNKFVVLTGGEPMLQVNSDFIEALHKFNFKVAIETNGTIRCPKNIDWICVSPKFGSELVQKCGDELKLIYPQGDVSPNNFLNLDFKHFLIQPMDGLRVKENIKKAVEFCQDNPEWRLSIQTHKITGIR